MVKRLLVGKAEACHGLAQKHGWPRKEWKQVHDPNDLRGYDRQCTVILTFGHERKPEVWDLLDMARARGMSIERMDW